MGVSGQRYAPAALSPGKTRYPLYGRLGGSQGWSGRVRKISPPPGFDPRTVLPIASRYTDWAIPAHQKRLAASPYPSVRLCMKQHLSDRTDCRKILCHALLLKSVDTFRLRLQPDRKKTLHTFLYCIFVPTTDVLLCEVRTEAEEIFDNLNVTFWHNQLQTCL